MPRNGNGTYTAPPSSWNPAINGNAATQGDWNVLLNDIATALTQSLSRDGQTPMGGNLSLGGNRLINVGQPVDDGDVLRKAQLVKGANIASATTLPIPMEGALFDVAGAASIYFFSDTYPGRMVALRFSGVLTIHNSANIQMPSGQDVVTQSGDVGVFINTEFGKWVCISYQTFSSDQNIWTSQPIGSYVAIRDDWVGVQTAPPNNSPLYRYVKLTASDSYNAGVIINESQTGTAPNIVATGQISLASSKLNGIVINMINTERQFLRAGNSGSWQMSQNASHAHTGTAQSSGAHAHDYNRAFIATPGAGGLEGGGGRELQQSIQVTSTGGSHTHTLTINNSGGDESRPRNIGVTYYMRIL